MKQVGRGVHLKRHDNEQNDNQGKTPYRKGYYYNRRRKYFNKTHQPRQEKISFKKLSIVVPLFNEEESLTLLANEIRKALKPVEIVYEVIFVDDGSTDGSLKVIKEICRQDKRFRYVSFRKNYGKSAASASRI